MMKKRMKNKIKKNRSKKSTNRERKSREKRVRNVMDSMLLDETVSDGWIEPRAGTEWRGGWAHRRTNGLRPAIDKWVTATLWSRVPIDGWCAARQAHNSSQSWTTHRERERERVAHPTRPLFCPSLDKKKNKKERTGLDLTNDYNDNKAELKKRQQKNKRHTNHQIANETKNKKKKKRVSSNRE